MAGCCLCWLGHQYRYHTFVCGFTKHGHCGIIYPFLHSQQLFIRGQQWQPHAFTLVENECPVPQVSVPVGWNIETIFPYKTNLYIGSTGVFIFNTNNPYRPHQISAFSHVTGCDPVVCANDLAFVTIHNGTTCGGVRNQLDILNISDPYAPTVLQSYNMVYPQGLATTDQYLYVCDDGFKIYDRSKPSNLKLKKHISGLDVTDVIALGNDLAILVGKDGFFQYNTTDADNPVLLSKIEVK